MAFDAAAAREAYKEAMGASRTKDKYKKGIQATTVNPMEEAANADDRFLTSVTESVTSGRRAAKLRSLPKANWSTPALGIGADRLATGAAKAAPKIDAHWAKFGPVIDQAQAAVRSMPKGSFDERMERSREFAKRMRQAAGRPV